MKTLIPTSGFSSTVDKIIPGGIDSINMHYLEYIGGIKLLQTKEDDMTQTHSGRVEGAENPHRGEPQSCNVQSQEHEHQENREHHERPAECTSEPASTGSSGGSAGCGGASGTGNNTNGGAGSGNVTAGNGDHDCAGPGTQAHNGEYDSDAQHAALVSADVTVGHDIDISASLLHLDLADLHVGLDFGHDICHA